MLDQLEFRTLRQMRHVLGTPGQKAVHRNDAATGRKQSVTEMRANEAGTPGHECRVHADLGSSPRKGLKKAMGSSPSIRPEPAHSVCPELVEGSIERKWAGVCNDSQLVQTEFHRLRALITPAPS